MKIIPAIDLKAGQCVRLVKGREDSARVYDRDPLDVARAYQQAGARLIHIVDLDAAFTGVGSDNQKIIRQIAAELATPIEVGGGIRTFDDIEFLLGEVGAGYCIVGTMMVEQPESVARAIQTFGDRIIVGIDAHGDNVAVRGWTEGSGRKATELAREVAQMGGTRVIYTDIARDGMLAGPNGEMTRRIAIESGLQVTASGGVSSLNDLVMLSRFEQDGVDSCIIGKALYEGRFTLEDAISTVQAGP